MKLPFLLGALLLSVSPAVALPTRLLCSESDGIYIIESDEVIEYLGTKRLEQSICGPDEDFLDDCSGETMFGKDSPYIIEFNLDTQEAVVNRDSDTIFYTIEETADQIQLIRKRRPFSESTYQSTGSQTFYTYSIVIEKDSLSSEYTKIEDITDWGGILYTTIINGSCKDHPL